MKWYIGIQAEIVAAIVGFGSIYYVQGQDELSLPTSTQNVLALTVFLVAFIGGFMAPYHVMKTARTGAISFAVLAGIPLVIILFATDEIASDDAPDFASVLILVLLLVVAIALVVAIVVVTILLFIGGYIGSIFGKMVFEKNQYEYNNKRSKYHDP